eukprot:c54315_g1_i1.p1 GENE.c54315_g1_i1~~c54315_g1_i1.p1  ORF type:complete len:130 (+),score=24.46 c54315_g1_i1:123-512(+)
MAAQATAKAVRGRLTNDQFLEQLGQMFTRSAAKSGPGTVFVTMKQVTESSTGGSKKAGTSADATEKRLLVRASLGKKKISTVVTAKSRVRFTAEYSALIRSSVTGLEKKDRKSRKQGDKSASAATSGAL